MSYMKREWLRQHDELGIDEPRNDMIGQSNPPAYPTQCRECGAEIIDNVCQCLDSEDRAAIQVEMEDKADRRRKGKRFTKRCKLSVDFGDGAIESFSIPECLVGRLAPVIAAHFRNTTIAVENRFHVVKSESGCASAAQRLSRFTALISGFFGRSYTTGGCAICGHATNQEE